MSEIISTSDIGRASTANDLTSDLVKTMTTSPPLLEMSGITAVAVFVLFVVYAKLGAVSIKKQK